MTGINNILCAVDLSYHSGGALHHAVGLAQQSNARLYVFHSIHSPRDPIYGTTEFNRGGDLEKKMAQIHSTIEGLMADCPVVWESIACLGDPVEESVRICDALGIDLVVAASHGISAFKRVFLGTVVERLARHINRPMLVSRSTARANLHDSVSPFHGYNHIVVGCDFHADTQPCIHLALNFAGWFRAPLHLLHVMESPLNQEMMDATEAPYGEVQQKLAAKTKQRIAAWLSETRSGAENIDISIDISTGIPAEEMIDHAKRLKADLIILGVRRRPRIDQIMVGSSTELVLRKAPCAVLTVPGGWTAG